MKRKQNKNKPNSNNDKNSVYDRKKITFLLPWEGWEGKSPQDLIPQASSPMSL